MQSEASSEILVSVIVLNYNGARWIERCVTSILGQTLEEFELIVVDNLSTDGSDVIAEKLVNGQPKARFVKHTENLGYCEGNNRGAASSRGEYILLLNNDAWLERDCLKNLVAEVEVAGAGAAMPRVMNWDDDEFQWGDAADGFDVFGLPVFPHSLPERTSNLMMPGGCSYLVRRDLFMMFGGLDRKIFMYADEWDLSWKVWISGNSAINAPSARCHHRGAANVNPVGGERVVQLRTSDTKRYFSNRNCLLVLAKNCSSFLLLLIPLQIGFLCLEALVGLVLIRRWSFIRRSYFEAIRDFFGLWPHIREERRKVKTFRKRGDFYMLRFLRLRLNRWDEFRQLLRKGVPKVDAR